MTLHLVSSNPSAFCIGWPSPFGGCYRSVCARCGRDIAVPRDLHGQMVWCLYCGLDAGLVPPVDVPIGAYAHDGCTVWHEARGRLT